MTKHYANSHTKLLSALQNKGVIDNLRPNCTALVTTVAIMRITNTTVMRFGVVTIEWDAKIRKCFFRFYNMNNMNLLIQREIKKYIGTPFTVMRSFYITMEINEVEPVEVLFEFIDTFDSRKGLFEYNEVMRALRGDLKGLKFEAEMKLYKENRHMYSYEKWSLFNRLLHGKKYGYVKKSKRELPHSDKSHPNDGGVEAARIAKYSLINWMSDPKIQTLLSDSGYHHEELYLKDDCRREVEQFIAKYGGTEKFKQTIVQHGFRSGLDESSPASPTLPKTPDKLLLDSIAAFDPAKQVGIPKKDDPCKSLGKRLEEEEEFVASEVIPEKVAEPAAKEKVGKRFLPDAFVFDLNMMFQRITEKLSKRKAKKKLKKEQKAKKGQPVSTTPEQTPEKEAPMPTENTPVKEASKTPEKNPSSVSDTTDETESDSENSD